LYEDFSSPTFDERHNLILGGSFASRGNLAMREARYAFRRHFFQHAGFRYVATKEPARKLPPHEYETDELSNNYLEFHFGPSYFGVPNFPKACIEFCFEMNEKYGIGWSKAADLGCAVGRSTFELATKFEDVVGMDLSVRFFQLGAKLLEKKVLKYEITREGKLKDRKEIDMDKLNFEGIKKRISFKQQDVTILDLKKFHSYDLVFCGNLIDRMATPKVFLHNIHKHLKKGGLLVLTSPYTWLANWTKPENWVGGYERAEGVEVRTLEGIRECLGDSFEQVGEQRDIPFVLRETARKYQHTLAQASCWKLK
jgi:putative 4-mercaptohistidine N1-methyltranferase